MELCILEQCEINVTGKVTKRHEKNNNNFLIRKYLKQIRTALLEIFIQPASPHIEIKDIQVCLAPHSEQNLVPLGWLCPH